MFAECTETVSILYALAFGAGEACVNIGIGSILSAFAAFMVVVVVLQFVARRLWARLTRVPTHHAFKPDEAEVPPVDTPYRDDPNYRDSAIRSSRR